MENNLPKNRAVARAMTALIFVLFALVLLDIKFELIKKKYVPTNTYKSNITMLGLYIYYDKQRSIKDSISIKY